LETGYDGNTTSAMKSENSLDSSTTRQRGQTLTRMRPLTLIHTNAGRSMFDALDMAQRAYERAQAQAAAEEEDGRWYAATLSDGTLLHEPRRAAS
jgi:hypothetical protein